MTNPEAAARAAIAAHRFGLGEADLAVVGTDATAWLEAQIGPADRAAVPAGDAAAPSSSAQALQLHARAPAERRPGGDDAMAAAADDPRQALRRAAEADVRSRLVTAATSARPFAERLVMHWCNHFTVSAAKNAVRGLAGAFEREAIRPHVAGRFETLLDASTRHAAMLRYLDNERSAGPDSRVVQRQGRRAAASGEAARITGLNENLAREVLELHTLGAEAQREGVYGQADVGALAAILTGWRTAPGGRAEGGDAVQFDPAWHQPGPKRLLGQRIDEGPDGLAQALRLLAGHPATARHVCTRLARHLIADEPPPALVARLAERWQRSDGDLAAVLRTLLRQPEAWAPAPAKLKTPEEFVVSSARLLGLGERAFQRPPDGGLAALGQRLQQAPSPAGWPESAAEWLGPDALWKRIEWATRVGDRLGSRLDARRLAEASLGPRLGAATRQQIERAADGPQALALLLLAPEFQRR